MRDLSLLLLALLALAGFTLLATVLAGQDWAEWAPDQAILNWAAGIGGRGLGLIMRGITTLGSLPVLFAVALCVAAWCLERRAYRLAALYLSFVCAAELVNVLLKAALARPRPALYGQVALPGSASFPSGHALMSTVIYGLAASLLLHFGWRRPRGLVLATTALLLLIGSSRILLGVHWPTDVLAGFTLGLFFLAAWELIRRRLPAPARSQREDQGLDSR